MTSNGNGGSNTNSNFSHAFLPGLILGLIVGAVAGAFLPDLMGGPRIPERQMSDAAPAGGGDRRDPRADQMADPSLQDEIDQMQTDIENAVDDTAGDVEESVEDLEDEPADPTDG